MRSRSHFAVVLAVCFFGPVASWTQTQAANPAGSPGVVKFSAEDWNSLSLAGSPLRAERPLLGEKDDLPLFTRELIRLQWRYSDPIDLYLICPKGVAKPPVILYLYTYPSETDRFRNDHFSIDATRNGFAAVGFVSALTGHRYKDRPMKEWFVSELPEALVKTVHDVQMILNYLATRDDLDTGHVGMFGEGSGGTIAVLAAAVEPRIEFIDLLDPWGDWPDWMANSARVPDQERTNYLKPEFLKKVAPFDPEDWLPRLKLQRIRLQQVLDDPVTPKVAKQRLESAAPKSAQVIDYPGTQEFFRAAMGGRLFDWIKEQIRPVSTAQSPAPDRERSNTSSAVSGRHD